MEEVTNLNGGSQSVGMELAYVLDEGAYVMDGVGSL